MSYFIGGRHSGGGYDEDGGFAINAGKGFKEVVFENHQISLNGNTAIAMGNYSFTCATTSEVAKVEYTLATSAATTARCASSSTTRRCRSPDEIRIGE